MHVAMSNGAGMKSCTWSGRSPLRFRNTASAIIACGSEQLADGRVDARQPLALRLDLGPRAAHLVHVRGRPAHVADDAVELGVGRHLANLVEHGLLRARLDDAALVGRDRAERAAAEA